MSYRDLTPCYICRIRPVAIHHIKSRGSGGGDEWWNVAGLCYEHHSEIHMIGDIAFMDKYHDYAAILQARGWEVIQENGRRRLIFTPK